jgi:hypothetical protein
MQEVYSILDGQASSAIVVPNVGIYVFHQDYRGNGQLWYSFFDGTTLNGTDWAPDMQVPNVGMSIVPSAVVVPTPAGAFTVFHQGLGQNGQLWYSYFDGVNWEQDMPVAKVGMS